MSKIMSKLTAVIMAAALTTSCIPVIAATEEDGYRDCDYPADYATLPLFIIRDISGKKLGALSNGGISAPR